MAISRLFNDSLSRSYYAAFHAVSMVLFLHDKAYSSHGQVIGAFNRDFIATGLLPKSLGKILADLYDNRQSADYDVFQSADHDDATSAIENARFVLNACMDYAIRHFGITGK